MGWESHREGPAALDHDRVGLVAGPVRPAVHEYQRRPAGCWLGVVRGRVVEVELQRRGDVPSAVGCRDSPPERTTSYRRRPLAESLSPIQRLRRTARGRSGGSTESALVVSHRQLLTALGHTIPCAYVMLASTSAPTAGLAPPDGAPAPAAGALISRASSRRTRSILLTELVCSVRLEATPAIAAWTWPGRQGISSDRVPRKRGISTD